MQLENLQFVIGNAHECGYLPARIARSAFLISDLQNTLSDYHSLIQQGFRRSGNWVYRPCCRNCSACVPVRIPVAGFHASRAQRRNWRGNGDLVVSAKPAIYDKSHFELYQRYIAARHPDGAMSKSGREEYMQFLTSDWASTCFYEFLLRQQVVAVAVVDHFDDALSAVYTFFEPELPNRGLGVYAILWEIKHAQELGLEYVYLGYWIAECAKMAYKIDYRPIEGHLDGRWQLIEDS